MDANPYRSPETENGHAGGNGPWWISAVLVLTATYGFTVGLPGLLFGAFAGSQQLLIGAACHVIAGIGASYFFWKTTT